LTWFVRSRQSGVPHSWQVRTWSGQAPGLMYVE
jgi:hypothetical protein